MSDQTHEQKMARINALGEKCAEACCGYTAEEVMTVAASLLVGSAKTLGIGRAQASLAILQFWNHQGGLEPRRDE